MSFENPILITGCPRSGTSLIAGIINLCGVFGGRVDKMGENIRIRDKIIKPFMLTQFYDPNGVDLPPLKDVTHTELIARPRIKGVLRVEGWDGIKQWMYKDRRIAVLYPTWHKMFPDATVIWVHRTKEQIINSCMKTTYMDSYDNEKGWDQMVNAYQRRLAAMQSIGMNVVEVRPEFIVDGYLEEIKDIIVKNTGVVWQEDKVKEYISPKLWQR